MAAIPEYREQVKSRPVNQTEIRVSTSDAAFGAGVGQAVQGAGQQMYKVADAINYKQQLIADAQAAEALNGLRDAKRQILMDPTTGLLNQTGANGMAVQQTGAEAMRTARERASEGLTGRALNAFNKQADEWDASSADRLIGHEATQTREYIVAQHGAAVAGFVEDAALSGADEGAFRSNIASAVAEQDRLEILKGTPPEEREAKRTALTSLAERQRILITAEKDPTQALALFEAARPGMTAKDQYEVGQTLEPLVLQAKTDAFISDFVQPGGVDLSAYAVEGGARAGAIEGLQPGFSAGIGQMFADAPPEIKEGLRIGSAYRSVERQAELWEQALAKYGSVAEARKWVAPPGKSQHGEGQAVDLKYASPEVKKWVHENAARYGMHFPLSNEPWHMEPIGARGGDHAHEGETAAQPDVRAEIAAAGIDVTPASEYLWRQLGPGLAPGLMQTAGTAPSTTVEKALGAAATQFLAANPQFKGKTVGEVVDWAAAQGGGGSAMAQPFFDVQAAYAAAMAMDDPRLQAEAFKRITAMQAMQNNVRDQARTDAQTSAWDNYVATGETNLGIEQRQAMGQSGWSSFQSAVEKDQLGLDMTNPDTHEELFRMSASDPQAFAKMNLSARYPELSRADRRAMVELQEAVRAKIRGDALTVEQKRVTMNYETMYDTADTVYNAMVPGAVSGEKASEAQKLARLDFQKQLTQRINEFYDKESREPNVMELREMATVLAMPVRIISPDDWTNMGTKGSFFEAAKRDDGSTFEVTMEYKDVPIDERTRLATLLTASNGGKVPTPEQITDAYEWQLQLDQGIAPAVDIGQVPQRIIDYEKSLDPAVTEDEIVERYRASLLAIGIN